MKKLFTLLLLTVMALAFAPQESKASHLAGADLTYTYTGIPNTYLFHLVVYRDCSGISVDPDYPICYESPSLGTSGTFTVNQINVIVVPQSPCVSFPANNCPGGQGDIEQYSYEGTITLPGTASDWRISWESNARNPAITTLVGAAGYSLYVDTYLDNVIAPTNNSPQFTGLAYSRFCVGNVFYYDQGAFDVDGDSLHFSLVDALSTTNLGSCPATPTPVSYVSGYSATNPLSSSVPIAIDPNTGVINFVPNQVQVGVIAVLVEEFRNGVQIGSVRRDLQINIISQCNAIIPSFLNSTLTSTPGGILLSNCNEHKVILAFDTSFQCGSAVPTDFRSFGPFGVPNPVIAVNPVNCQNGLTDSIEVTFLNPLSVGQTKVWVKRGFDGNTLLSECGSELLEGADTVNVFVQVDASTLFPVNDSLNCIFNTFTVFLSDSVYCFSIAPDGSDFLLVDGAGNNYPIAAAYGNCTGNTLKSLSVTIVMANNVSAAGPVYLMINNGGSTDGNTLADDCGVFYINLDTLAVFGVNNKIAVNLGSDQQLCSFEPVPVLNSGWATLTNQWYDQNGVITGANTSTYTASTSGTYIVTVNNGPGCSGQDTVVVTIIPAPSDNLPADFTQCINDPLPTLDAGNTGAIFQWYLNGVAISGATSQTYSPTVGGVYSVTVDNGNPNCIGNFDVDIITNNPYVVTLSNQTICSNGTYPILDAGNPGASYQWNLGGNPISGATSQTYQTTQAGTYSVTVGTGACAGSASMDLTVTPLPVVTLSNASICDYDPIAAIDAGNAGASYQWYQNGTAISGATSQNYTPTAAGTYSVDVTNNGCTSNGSMSLTINPAPVFTIADTNICNDGSAFIDPVVTGDSYAWSTGATTQTITTSTAGTYTLTITTAGCNYSKSANVVVFNYPAAPTVACTPGTGAFKYIYTWSAIAGAVSYEVTEDGGATWIPANTPSGSETHGTTNAIADFSVRAIGGGLCKIGAASEPTACEVTIPNIITPNNDGKNDVFTISNIEQYPGNTVQIFNRWGKEVYSADGYNNADKKFVGTDCPDGVYFVIVILGDGTPAKTSTLTINR
jgi:gliding motility-associated-like protein